MSRKIKAFCCWSGGKDSALALYLAKRAGIDILYLVNMMSGDGKHSRTHGIGYSYIKSQAESIGIPIIQKRTSWKNYENEFKKVVSALKDKGITAGIFGDIDLKEHRDWVEKVSNEVGVKPILPLWKEKREKLLKLFIGSGFKTIIVATIAKLMGKEWLGREINEKFIQDLKTYDKAIDLCGEGGEYHTFVYDGPIFQKPVGFPIGDKVLRNRHWFLEIKKGPCSTS